MIATKRLIPTLSKAIINDHELVYGHWKLRHLVRSYFLLRICGYPKFARNAYKIFSTSRKMLGDRIFAGVFRPFVYNVFVAGHRSEEILNAARSIKASGCIPFLSPMLENDADAVQLDDREQVHQRNFQTIMQCIQLWNHQELCQISSKVVAIKLTAFLHTDLLLKLSEVSSARDKETAYRLIRNLLDGQSLRDENDLVDPETFRYAWKGIQNLLSICDEAKKSGVTLFIDAEHSHLQQGVRHLSMCLMERYNKNVKQITLANTYQCYLTRSFDDIKEDLKMAEELEFRLGLKIVRGAYLNHEKRIAARENVECPVFSTYEDTNVNYDRIVKFLLDMTMKSPKHHHHLLVIATHNWNSIERALSTLGSNPDPPTVHFAQINGIADRVSAALASSGLSCWKLIPIGTVEDVIPWLARRMEENFVSFARCKEDMHLIASEIFSRPKKLVSKFYSKIKQ